MHLPSSEPDDAPLISEALLGEAAAFEQLFNRYDTMIHFFAQRLSGHSSDADEIAQETFIKAARGLAGFRGGDFRCWLYRIATNCARDLHRTSSRRTMAETEAIGQMQTESTEPSRSAAAVRDALAGLTLEHRETVVLVYFEGLTHAEASRVLGCAETTVSWRLFRAKRQLKTMLSRSL